RLPAAAAGDPKPPLRPPKVNADHRPTRAKSGFVEPPPLPAAARAAGRQENPVSRLLSTIATIFRLARPYFFSEDPFAGRLRLGGVIAIELMIVGINVMLNQWNNRFYNALQERNWDTFVYELGFFCVLATAYIVLAVYQLYLNQWLQIRWRRWMTREYLDH